MHRYRLLLCAPSLQNVCDYGSSQHLIHISLSGKHPLYVPLSPLICSTSVTFSKPSFLVTCLRNVSSPSDSKYKCHFPFIFLKTFTTRSRVICQNQLNWWKCLIHLQCLNPDDKDTPGYFISSGLHIRDGQE